MLALHRLLVLSALALSVSIQAAPLGAAESRELGHVSRYDSDFYGPRDVEEDNTVRARDDHYKPGFYGPRDDHYKPGFYGPRDDRDHYKPGFYGPRDDHYKPGFYGPRDDHYKPGFYGPRDDAKESSVEAHE